MYPSFGITYSRFVLYNCKTIFTFFFININTKYIRVFIKILFIFIALNILKQFIIKDTLREGLKKYVK